MKEYMESSRIYIDTEGVKGMVGIDFVMAKRSARGIVAYRDLKPETARELARLLINAADEIDGGSEDGAPKI